MQYRPQPIANRVFIFPDSLVASAIDTEFDFIRIDEASVRFPYGSSLRKALARLEAISTLSICGPIPDLHLMIWLCATQAANGEAFFDSSPFPCPPEVARATIAAFRYEQVIEKISSSLRGSPINEHDFLAMHSYIAHGSTKPEEIRYRRRAHSCTKPGGESIGKTYAPPMPDEVPVLMNDLFEFVRTPRSTPSIQAALAHFQLQAICPFGSFMDFTDRSLSQTILHQRGVTQHLIPTIGLPLASNFPNYVQALMPYRHVKGDGPLDMQQALERWIACCLEDTRKSTRVVQTYMGHVRSIVESYQSRIGAYRHGSTVDVLIRELPGMPLLNSKIAMELTGKGFTAVSEALVLLANRGILRQVGANQRNRVFEAYEIIDNEQYILDTTLPKSACKWKEPNL